MTRLWAILTIVVGVGAVSVSGHHAFASYYLEDQTISIEGALEQFEYTNPHAWIHIATADSSGQVQRISAEWANPNRLRQQGVDKDTLKPGDRLIVTGSPSRHPTEYKIHLKRLERPADGWKWIGRGQQQR
jgi:hypothetical protein